MWHRSPTRPAFRAAGLGVVRMIICLVYGGGIRPSSWVGGIVTLGFAVRSGSAGEETPSAHLDRQRRRCPVERTDVPEPT